MIHKAPLTGNWLRGPLHFTFPQTSSAQHQFQRVQPLIIGFPVFPFFLRFHMCACAHISTDEKEIVSVLGKTGQDIKWQIKWWGLPMELLGMPIHIRYNILLVEKVQYPLTPSLWRYWTSQLSLKVFLMYIVYIYCNISTSDHIFIDF
jgi:hypothetical protein